MGIQFRLSSVNWLRLARVPLERLTLLRCKSDGCLFDGVLRMKTLKWFYLLNNNDLNISHWLTICEYLNELSNLVVGRCDTLNSNGLSALVRNAKELQLINLRRNDVEIDRKTYETMTNIIKERAMKTPLELYINTSCLVRPSHKIWDTTDNYLSVFPDNPNIEYPS